MNDDMNGSILCVMLCSTPCSGLSLRDKCASGLVLMVLAQADGSWALICSFGFKVTAVPSAVGEDKSESRNVILYCSQLKSALNFFRICYSLSPCMEFIRGCCF